MESGINVNCLKKKVTPSGWLSDRTALPFARLSCHPDGVWGGEVDSGEIGSVYLFFFCGTTFNDLKISCNFREFILSISKNTDEAFISSLVIDATIHRLFTKIYSNGSTFRTNK